MGGGTYERQKERDGNVLLSFECGKSTIQIKCICYYYYFVREIIKYADSERAVSYIYISHIGMFYSNRAISSWREIVTEVALPLYL